MISKMLTNASRKCLKRASVNRNPLLGSCHRQGQLLAANFTVEVEDESFGSRGWTKGEFHSVENTLKEKLSEEDYTNVTKVLYGLNQGETVKELPVPRAAKSLAEKGDFDITLHKFAAAKEPRDQRIVRFGVTQNSIIKETTAPVDEQYEALEERHREFVEAAAAAGTIVLCFQEAWTQCRLHSVPAKNCRG